MAQPIPRSSLLRSFRRHLEAENRSERTLASYLQSVRQAEAFLASRGKRPEEASRADWRRSWETCCDGGHPLQGVAHPVPLAGGRGGDRGQPGARSGEFAGLKLADVDFDPDMLLVLGKGRRGRALPFGRKATLALDRTGGLASVTRRHRWTGYGSARRGATASGLAQMLERRGHQAGLPDLYPYRLRHTFVHSGSRKAVAKRT
jgi:site-specific recombinase XerD